MILCLLLLSLLLFSPNAPSETVTIFATGQTLGNLEQCGCAKAIEGGVEALAGYLKEASSEASNPILVDVGAFMPEETEPVDTEMGLSRLRAIGRLGSHITLLSLVDLAHGQSVLRQSQEETGIMYLSSQLDSSNPKFWHPTIIKEIGSLRIGFVGMTALKSNPKLGKEYTLQDTMTSITKSVAEIRDQADLVVLLAHEPSLFMGPWLKAYPGPKIDLVIALDFGSKPQRIDNTWLVDCGGKGKSVARIQFDIEKEKGIENLRYENVSLKPENYPNREMRMFLDKLYDGMVRKLDLRLKQAPVLQSLPEEADKENSYIGASVCKTCHEPQYAQWEASRHAIAFHRLLNENRHWVPRCAMCHTTGYGNPSGFTSFPAFSSLVGVQCETCHGPAGKHAREDGDPKSIRRKAPKELCIQCHDKENSPDFEEFFDLYIKQVVH